METANTKHQNKVQEGGWGGAEDRTECEARVYTSKATSILQYHKDG